MKKELTLKEIQQIELELLLEFRDICNKLGLKYYLIGGTILGAIRHQGFIPWDDDIDVAMPRPDYQKLMEFSKEYNNSTNKFLFFDKYNSMLPFTKFVNTKTHINSNFSNDEFYRHIWIDIIPLDGLPESNLKIKIIYFKAKFFQKIIMLSDYKYTNKNLLKMIINYIFKLFIPLYGKHNAINKLSKLSMQYKFDQSKYVGVVSWGMYGTSERMLKSDIGDGCKVTFEGHKFNTFCCWDNYLKSLFGNYMKLPPKEKRISHHIVAYLEN